MVGPDTGAMEMKRSRQIKNHLGDFPDGPLAETPHSQGRGTEFDPWSRRWIPHATTESSHATKSN